MKKHSAKWWKVYNDTYTNTYWKVRGNPSERRDAVLTQVATIAAEELEFAKSARLAETQGVARD